MAEEGGGEQGKHHFKNKKKKLQKRAKLAANEETKKSNVDKETLEYFRHVNGLLDADNFEDDEEREIFMDNVFAQAEGVELKLAQDQDCSAILERLLRSSNHTQVLCFFQRLSGRYGAMAPDRFASHVLQTILSLLPAILAAQATSEQDDDSTSAEQLFLAMCNELSPEWYRLSEDSYGSHIVRVVVGLASGGGLPSDLVRSKNSRAFRIRGEETKAPTEEVEQEYDAPASFRPLLDRICEAIMGRNYMISELGNPALSAVVQSLLMALSKKRAKACRKLVMKLLNQPDVNAAELSTMDVQHIEQRLITDPIGSRLMEVILKVADVDILHRLYRECFRGKMVEFGKHPVANFVVSHLLASTKTETEASLMIEELLESVETLLAHGHIIVVIKMVEACLLAPKLQKKVVNAIFKSFHINDPADQKEIIPLALRLTTLETYRGEDGTAAAGKAMALKLNGALLLQAIFKLDQNTINPVAISLLSLGVEGVLALALHPIGAHVVEGFMKGNVDLNMKKRLIKLLKGNYVKLAVDKNGSHTVDACWARSDLKNKELIADELLAKEDELKDSFYGRKVMFNCHFEHIKRKRDTWKDKEAANEKKKAMFADILQEDPQPKKKAKEPKKAKPKPDEELELPPNEIDDVFAVARGRGKKRDHQAPVKEEAETEAQSEGKKKKKKKDQAVGKTDQTEEEKEKMKDDMVEMSSILKESKKKKKSKKRKEEEEESEGPKKKKKKFMMS
eukprot:comp24333_c1_seq1/m.46036 comp24333_c1_seq1/g.46036  ORF comp24333_c1_seq1/g.46036 comp24333_c1_seq1/m.46036 type:complete len:737 (-) comp24333_c1_seq1:628-2838(-)